MKKFIKKKRGFTILEMLIVMAVSSILLTTIGFAILTFQRSFAEKTERHHTAFYLEQIVKRLQLEFPGANTVPTLNSVLDFTPLTEIEGTFNSARFGDVKHLFVAKYDDLFDPDSGYDTLKFLFVSHVDFGGNMTAQSDLGIKTFNLNAYAVSGDLAASVTKMEFIARDLKPSDAILEEAIVTNADSRWYLIGFFFRVRNYWHKDKSIEIASGKRSTYNFDLTLNTNIKIRN